MGFLFFFLCLPFPNVCFLFETNFPNIPFFETQVAFIFGSLFFLLCSCFCFHGVCFSLSVSILFFWYFLVFVLCFGFWLVSCFAFSLWKKLFPCDSAVFWVMLVKRVVWFLCGMFLFLFVFLVLLVFIFKNSFVLLCFCVVVVTRLSGFLVCILWSFFLFCFFCSFVLNMSFFITPKKNQRRHSKNPKKQKCWKKKRKNQLAQLCSQIVFFNFLGWA